MPTRRITDTEPWYRQFWPWMLIALPAAAVVACFITLWLALTHADPLVIKDSQYQQVRSELRAQAGDDAPGEDDG
ncbi:MAG: hypothetical protein HKO64_00875 [Xanthomonadales bacterium]|nr:FixH family protein [Gammaproteobacteria bacterium]NNE04516.1 hypothetical protein [Xanthomonadales bacterium]NNL94150.1 hypothetical protein [Xanthomonadales bacterium]